MKINTDINDKKIKINDIIKSEVYKLFSSHNQNLYLVGLSSVIADVRLIFKNN